MNILTEDEDSILNNILFEKKGENSFHKAMLNVPIELIVEFLIYYSNTN